MSLPEKLAPVLLTGGPDIDSDVVVAWFAKFRVESRVELEGCGGRAGARDGGGAILDFRVFRSTVNRLIRLTVTVNPINCDS